MLLFCLIKVVFCIIYSDFLKFMHVLHREHGTKHLSVKKLEKVGKHKSGRIIAKMMKLLRKYKAMMK